MSVPSDLPIAPTLAPAPTLQPMDTAAVSFHALVSHVAAQTGSSDHATVDVDAQRDGYLADYRRAFDRQLRHDLSYNLQALWRWSQILGHGHTLSRDGQVTGAFRRLNGLRDYLSVEDGWSGAQAEMDCGLAVQQFYHDALALGDRLWRIERGQRLRCRPARTLRRRNVAGMSSDSLLQALMNAADTVVPGFPVIRPLRAFLPVLAYQGMRMIVPWPHFEYLKWLGKLQRVLDSGAMASLNRLRGDIVAGRGVASFRSDSYFFEGATGQTRHNIILAFSHRHSTFDDAVMARVLDGLDHGAWVNARYLPRSAARDPHSVCVEPGAKRSMEAVLTQSADILTHRRRPLVVYVDGSVSYLCYGQQMRVKRGIRLLVEYMKARSSGTARRTYVVPVSLDDTVAFIRGLDSQVRVTVHRPICVDDVTTAAAPPDRTCVNWGDPLLNHLECLFLVNTGQVRHGWRTPRVVETVRRVARERAGDGSWRGRLRRGVHASMYDLARYVPEDPCGPPVASGAD